MFNICMIEDDLDWVAEFHAYGTMEGHAVTSFSSGTEAAPILRKLDRFFDVFVIDHTLPGLSGVELLRSIREGGVDTPAIFCTSEDSMKVMSGAFGAGADAYLLKPVSAEVCWMQVSAVALRAAVSFVGSPSAPVRSKFQISHIPSKNSFVIDGVCLSLPPLQARLLNIFLHKDGGVVKIGELIRSTKTDSQNALAIQICKLRKGLAPFGLTVLSAYGEGYRLCIDERSLRELQSPC